MDIVLKQAVNVAVTVAFSATLCLVVVKMWRAGTLIKESNRAKRVEIDKLRAETDLLRAANAHRKRVQAVMRVIAEDTADRKFPSDVYALELAERTQQPIEVVFEAIDECLATVPSQTRSAWFGRNYDSK